MPLKKSGHRPRFPTFGIAGESLRNRIEGPDDFFFVEMRDNREVGLGL